MRSKTTIIFYMETIYIDRLFALNFIIDYLILLGSARICGIFMRRGRYLLAAALGGVYAAVSVLPGMALLSSAPMKLLFAVLMSLIAFLGEKRFLRCLLVFLAVSALFGGALWALSLSGSAGAYLPLSFTTLLVSFLIIYALLSLLFRRSLKGAEKRISEVLVQRGGKEVRFMALRDSGNSLCDPISGAGVIIISPELALPLFGEQDWARPADAVTKLPGMRLIPYNAVGTESGLLAAFRPDRLELDGAPCDSMVIAVSPVKIQGDGYLAVAQE